jgi:hypothetical protein
MSQNNIHSLEALFAQKSGIQVGFINDQEFQKALDALYLIPDVMTLSQVNMVFQSADKMQQRTIATKQLADFIV